MKNLKKTIAEEAAAINNRVKKSSISVSLSHSNDPEVNLSEEMPIPEALRQINLLKNKK
ncbi:hypothetical protein NEMIN01_1449 [Nematocida minor]|uniref:uncharacterized protein n=1 Tax=Nematocida minor TaxID=1912983 RepID=UPI00221EB65A|nr:uncharacterized protein NEMIN01_1449 [Nematocida minor]KAI5191290.1 hypothetical protein NEMIN01_1449 [Nematocida minor]